MSSGPALDRRAAALAAAEARLRPPPSAEEGSSTSSVPQEPVWVQPTEREDDAARKNFRRLMDRGIVRDNGYKQSAEAVETLLKIANNILANTDEPKYRDLKETNAALQKKVLSVRGGHDYLIALGFRTRTVDFSKHYVLQPSMKRMHELKLGTEVLQSYIADLQARAAGLTTSKTNAKADEAARIAKALREIEDDRGLVKSRVERERMGREAREKMAREQAEKEATEQESTVTGQGNEDQMMQDTAEEDDDDDEDYEDDETEKWTGGRKLGADPIQSGQEASTTTAGSATRRRTSAAATTLPNPEDEAPGMQDFAATAAAVGFGSGASPHLDMGAPQIPRQQASAPSPRRSSRRQRSGAHDPFPEASLGRRLDDDTHS